MRVLDDGRITMFGEHEDKVVNQLRNGLAQEDGSIGVLCADGHFGYGVPVGGVIAYRESVSPAAVGYDIGCGNLAVATSIQAQDLKPVLPAIMDRIFAEVSFGLGGAGGVDDHPVFDVIKGAHYGPVKDMLSKARTQLGTVGGGNHYVDLFEDESGRVWIGVHFGSRGFGWLIGAGFMSLAQGGTFDQKPKEGGHGEDEVPPYVLRLDSSLGHLYMDSMRIAGEYAYAGRETVISQVLGILGAETFGEPVHNHHNFAWMEEHNGEKFCVVRKGATPAAPGQKGFVGASMGEFAVILEGVDSEESVASLRSTVHGAGRAMSRVKAAGKEKKRWTCETRECDWRQLPGTHKPEDGLCPVCGTDKLVKRWIREAEGVIDWQATLKDLKAKGIELRGANAEEAPGAYKRLSDVLAHHDGTVRILHTLTPLGVAMAPGDLRDPYKD